MRSSVDKPNPTRRIGMKAQASPAPKPDKPERKQTPAKTISEREKKLFAFLDEVGRLVAKLVPHID